MGIPSANRWCLRLAGANLSAYLDLHMYDILILGGKQMLAHRITSAEFHFDCKLSLWALAANM